MRNHAHGPVNFSASSGTNLLSNVAIASPGTGPGHTTGVFEATLWFAVEILTVDLKDETTGRGIKVCYGNPEIQSRRL